MVCDTFEFVKSLEIGGAFQIRLRRFRPSKHWVLLPVCPRALLRSHGSPLLRFAAQVASEHATLLRLDATDFEAIRDDVATRAYADQVRRNSGGLGRGCHGSELRRRRLLPQSIGNGVRRWGALTRFCLW